MKHFRIRRTLNCEKAYWETRTRIFIFARKSHILAVVQWRVGYIVWPGDCAVANPSLESRSGENGAKIRSPINCISLVIQTWTADKSVTHEKDDDT
jgi:hypothetical protein